MSNSEQFNNIAEKILAAAKSLDKNSNRSSKGNSKCSDPMHLDTSALLTIIGLLTGSMSVASIFLNADQTFNIFLVGELKALLPTSKTNNSDGQTDSNDSTTSSQKSELQKNLDDICSKPFDEVIKAFINRQL